MTTHVVDARPRRSAPKLAFGDYVRAARREMNLNQAAFADLLGIKSATLGAWETGRNTPDDLAQVAELLERVTGISRAWFLGWGDAPAPKPPVNSDWRSRRPLPGFRRRTTAGPRSVAA